MSYQTKEAMRALLPKLGEKRTEIPTIDDTNGTHMTKQPMEGVVVYVNTEHLWYTVQFENGARESYKIPHVKPTGGGGYA